MRPEGAVRLPWAQKSDDPPVTPRGRLAALRDALRLWQA